MIVAFSKDTLDGLLRLTVIRFRCRMVLIATICLCLVHWGVSITDQMTATPMIPNLYAPLMPYMWQLHTIADSLIIVMCVWGWAVLQIPSRMNSVHSSLYSYAFIKVKSWQATLLGFISWITVLIWAFMVILAITILEVLTLSQPRCVESAKNLCIGFARPPMAMITLVLALWRSMSLFAIGAMVPQAHSETDYFYGSVEEFAVEEEEEIPPPPPAYFETAKYSPPPCYEEITSIIPSISVQ
jgi:hypothetical protein